ncbi:50S ribosomal protein L23 [Desulfurivibrio alkaliphilus]|uniref:Large ribosomal subunit protein uL23 n=1 Tax=Desulfurivibrio alkaliphilus (strain DSM 19089 / UNIQEM U267 / AHT2) TaxID=589865 RepID=D6Z3M0_DESAT|nr:50S ribosomal protein L23 [Desulfurivibrio alkaliphilus]ADH86145.1 Ribosomal protein L25/L23 [Desulfurivibrio alkaliphilus AHT 2]
MKNIYEVLKRPRLTEKSMGLQESFNQVVLQVDRRANKSEIKQAVEELFSVKVDKVRTANMTGRRRRMSRYVGRTSDYKKAFVTLSADSKLDFLEEL